MARLAAALVLVSTLLAGSIAGAESMVAPYCKCNDDCKWKWPYSGVCVFKWGDQFCGYYNEGPGIPCTDGGVILPKPDVLPSIDVVTEKACTCNNECAYYGAAKYCAKTPHGLRCSSWAPGIACDAGGPKKDWEPPRTDLYSPRPPDSGVFTRESDPLPPSTCSCDDDCQGSGYGALCQISAGRGYCTITGQGTPCGGTNVPSRGCSYARSAGNAGAGAMVLLLGVAGSLIVRRRRR